MMNSSPACRKSMETGVARSQLRHNLLMRLRGTLALAVAAAVLAGCEKQSDETARDPVAEIKHAARATLAQPWNAMDVRVASRRTGYRVRGRIEPARDRYVGEARFVRGAKSAFPDPRISVIGTGPEAYIGQPDLPGLPNGRRCWFDPHLPIGSAARIASVQESLAVIGITTRLLAKATERAQIVSSESETGGTQYEVWVDRSVAKAIDPGSDELFAARPQELADEIRLPLVAHTLGGRLSRISLELPRFESSAFLRRFQGIASVSIEASLTPTDKRPNLRAPNCIAME